MVKGAWSLREGNPAMDTSEALRIDRRRLLKAGSIVTIAGAAGVSGLVEACRPLVTPATQATSAPAAAGGADTSGGKQPRVVFISGKPVDPFGAAIKNGADQAAKDFGVDYVFQSPNGTSFPEQIQTTLAAIATKPDGMGICYFDKTFEDSTTKALDAGIKVVLYNNNRFEGENKPADERIPRLAFVGQDEGTSGDKLASVFVPTLKAGTNVLLINPFPVAYVLTLRRDGVARVLDQAGFQHQDLNMDSTGDEGKYLSIIGPYLQTHPEIGAVVGMGNPGANPAAKYLSDNQLSYPIATFDVGAETSNYIQQGVIAMAINQQPYLQGYMTIANLALALKFGFQPVDVNTGTEIVDKSNIAEVLQLLNEGKG
jgi:simple sugar transport system substrate-binding protein